jgi:syntaxin 5
MVEEQGEKAARVDENIEESISNVDSAKAQLDKYLASIKSNWKLMAKVVAVIIVFMVFFAFIA